VAFGTSAPELAVSIMSSLSGAPDIALGNVIGSNIFNILFVLGISSIFIPLIVQQQLIRLDVPALWEGLLLVFIGIVYTVFIIRQSRKEKSKEVLKEYQEEYGDEKKPKEGRLWLSVLIVIAGLALLVLGSRWMVNSAVEIAKIFGVSDLVIGLTIIAVGTSLPEVATSVVAAIRGERDIAVGNAVGSSIFNIVFILGLAASIGNGLSVSPSALRFDIPVMIAVSVACLPIFFIGKQLYRWEGALFLFYYFAYATYLVLASLKHTSLEIFSKAMIWFTIPLTVLTLTILTIREFRK
jgi:cation:H+ antiporter